MYNLPYFKADEQQQVLAFMHKHTFITLCTCDADNKPVATHVPVLIEEREGKLILLGHVMKHTDHHKALLQNNNVLAIFTGPHTYVSASWYVNQKQGGTWNYLTVHAKGTLTFLGEDALLKILTKLTAHHENNESSPSLVENLPEEYVQRLIKAIEGFEIEVTEIDHVFKLSQNRDEESYHKIIEHLQQGDSNSQQMAAIMQQRIKTQQKSMTVDR